MRRACNFLASKQLEDGGWGESYLSSQDKKYVSLEKSHIVNTSWALLGLLAVDCIDSKKDVIERGIQFLQKAQLANGDWPQQSISGVFNRNCMITYANYRNIFPLWAIGSYYSQL